MIRDERLYAFIVARTSRSRSRIRRISIRKRWLKASAGAAVMIFCAAIYGLYSLSQHVVHLRLERENRRLQFENEKQRRQLDKLKDRIEAVEDASRRLAEISGVDEQGAAEGLRGSGGPPEMVDAATIAAVERRASYLEQELQKYENILRERARIPSAWPAEGELTDSFGMRRSPFGEEAPEFHAGLDISAAWGTPVTAAGSGTVNFAGVQNGYGQVVIIDHGNGFTTRYGHLSRIDVAEGQELARGEILGRIGSTGRSTGPHLHYEVRINEGAVNPRRYLPRKEN